MKSFIARAVAAGSLFAALAVSGCRPVDSAVDCNRICNRYSTCFDRDYNVANCESRCRSNANSNTEYYRDVDTCEACIDDRSCSSATFNCASSCGNVVP